VAFVGVASPIEEALIVAAPTEGALIVASPTEAVHIAEPQRIEVERSFDGGQL
jgi:hypothetical protein